jgi:hypothetical protein
MAAFSNCFYTGVINHLARSGCIKAAIVQPVGFMLIPGEGFYYTVCVPVLQ